MRLDFVSVYPSLQDRRAAGARAFMLSIRQEQFRVFQDAERERFVKRMVLHMKSVFPDQTKTMNDEYLRRWIRLGIARSGKYDITTEWDVRRYLERNAAIPLLRDR
jgi:hypothetical protein